MHHSFDVDVAKEYGILCAVILEHMYFWVEKNKANEVHFYDGFYWTYNSVKAFKEQFPYASDKQIRNSIDKLEESGLILTGNYNKSAYDRTKWYALTEKAYSILQKGQIDLSKRANGNTQKGEPIPDINTDINTNITVSIDTVCQTGNPVRRAVEEWNTLESFGIQPVKKIQTTSTRYKNMNARIKEYGLEEVLRTIRMIKDCDFLLGKVSGKGGRAFFITFDWFVLPNNFPKVNEGKYLNRDVNSSTCLTGTTEEDEEIQELRRLGYQ